MLFLGAIWPMVNRLDKKIQTNILKEKSIYFLNHIISSVANKCSCVKVETNAVYSSKFSVACHHILGKYIISPGFNVHSNGRSVGSIDR